MKLLKNDGQLSAVSALTASSPALAMLIAWNRIECTSRRPFDTNA
jgi:hypothetical protein